MKFARFSMLAAVALTAFAMAAPAEARRGAPAEPTTHQIEPVLNDPEFATATEGVRFFFGNQPHPAVAQRIEQNVTTARPARSRFRDAEMACQRAMLNSLVALRDYALRHGGNAVINIRSNTNLLERSSRTEYQCVAGRMRATAALKGDVVRLR
ncbi:MAG TPA: hypothetical protein PLK37_00605 [Terricaulis sp.]|nr:hypothetical protein [Terricaulis sp.]